MLIMLCAAARLITKFTSGDLRERTARLNIARAAGLFQERCQAVLHQPDD